MGLTNETSNTWLRLSRGAFLLKVHSDTPGAKAVERSDGTVVHFLAYNTLSGYLTGVDVRTNRFDGEEIFFTITDEEGASYSFSVPIDSRNARALMAQLMSADITKKVKVRAWGEDYEGKTVTRVIVTQDGKALPWHFVSTRNEKAKDLPEERIMPDAKEVIVNGKKVFVNGKKVFDRTEQIAFIRGKVQELKDKLAGSVREDAVDDFDMPPSAPQTAKESNDDFDDLPF